MRLAFTAEQFRQKAPRPPLNVRSRVIEFGVLVLLCLVFSPVAASVQSQLPPWPLAMASESLALWLTLLVAVPVSIYLSVAVHEAGHLLMGLAVGYRFVLIRVGMIGLAREVGGLRLRWVGNNLFAMRGSTVVLTTVAHRHRWRELMVLAGGPLAQALILGGLLGVCHTIQDQPLALWPLALWPLALWPLALWLTALLHTLVFLTLMGLGSSLIPLRVGMVATDAHHILRLLRGGAEVDRQLLIQRLTAHAFFDTAYADLDPILLATVSQPTIGSRNDYAANLLAAASTLAQDEVDAARQHLDQVLAFVHAHPMMRQAAWPFLYAARYELSAGAGVQAARQWLSLLERQGESYLAVDHEQARLHLEAAILLAEGKLAAAKSAAQQSLTLLSRRLDRGCIATEQKHLLALLAQTDQAQIITRPFSAKPALPLFASRSYRFLLQTGMSLAGFVFICALF